MIQIYNNYDEIKLWNDVNNLYNSFVDTYEYFDSKAQNLKSLLKSNQTYFNEFHNIQSELLERFR